MEIMQLLAQYYAERNIWEKVGRPERSEKRIRELYNICTRCPNFQHKRGWIPGYDRCGICQCNLHPSTLIMNKLAWATTSCPNEPPLWTADVACHESK